MARLYWAGHPDHDRLSQHAELLLVHGVDLCESIGDPTTSPSLSSDRNDVEYQLRLCHVTEWPGFDGFGFNVHTLKDKPGQYVGHVDTDSPAAAAGCDAIASSSIPFKDAMGSKCSFSSIQRIHSRSSFRSIFAPTDPGHSLSCNAARRYSNGRLCTEWVRAVAIIYCSACCLSSEHISLI